MKTNTNTSFVHWDTINVRFFMVFRLVFIKKHRILRHFRPPRPAAISTYQQHAHPSGEVCLPLNHNARYVAKEHSFSERTLQFVSIFLYFCNVQILISELKIDGAQVQLHNDTRTDCLGIISDFALVFATIFGITICITNLLLCKTILLL